MGILSPAVLAYWDEAMRVTSGRPNFALTAFYEVQGGPGPTPTDVPPSDRGCAPSLRAFSSRESKGYPLLKPPAS